MYRLQNWSPTVFCICICTLVFFSGTAATAQGRGKDHPTHKEQVKTKEKAKTKEKDGKVTYQHEAKSEEKARPERPAGTSGTQMRFYGLDKNHDGVITRAEWQGSRRSFANADWDHNGVLSGNEVRLGATRPVAGVPTPGGGESDEVLFARFDVNRDGVLSRSEFNGSTGLFNNIDFDHDGVLNPYEFGVGR